MRIREDAIEPYARSLARERASEAETDARKVTEALREALVEARAALKLDDVPEREAVHATSAIVETAEARHSELAGAEEEAQRTAVAAERAHEELKGSHERADSALAERAKGIDKARTSLQERRVALPIRLTGLGSMADAALVAAQERVEKAQNDAQALADTRTRTTRRSRTPPRR